MTTNIPFMRMINRPRVAIALISTIIVAAPAPAQVSGPKMIPTALAKAMFGEWGEMMGGIEFVVGKSPDHWPKSIVAPAQARIVGGGKLGPILTTIYEYPSQGDVSGSFDAQLQKAGFKKSEAKGFSPPGGFTSSTGPTHAQSYCGDKSAVGFQQVDSTKTSRTLVVSFVADKERSSTCSTQANGANPAALSLPTLRPPAGVNVRPGGTGSGTDNIETRARIDTTLSASEILAHYVKELTAAGWKPARAPVLGDGVALHQVSARDEKGEEWRGALTVLTSRSEREVILRMIRDAQER